MSTLSTPTICRACQALILAVLMALASQGAESLVLITDMACAPGAALVARVTDGTPERVELEALNALLFVPSRISVTCHYQPP